MNHRSPRIRRQKESYEKTLEIIVENLAKLGKEIATQFQEIQSPKQDNLRQNTTRHMLIKLMKIKHNKQILKSAREKKQITHKGIPMRITATFQ